MDGNVQEVYRTLRHLGLYSAIVPGVRWTSGIRKPSTVVQTDTGLIHLFRVFPLQGDYSENLSFPPFL